ncbi:MAG: outer membrane beta-barrel protein [Lacibacter sp.]|jgi:opacity protein-like surface antigen
MKQFLRRTVTAFLCTISLPVLAQYEGFRHEGEFGIQLGAAHYFGDLNPTTRLNRPKIAGGVFFRKQVNDYVALRIGANFAQLGYSDVYEKDNEFRRRRNLSFNTNIWELMVQGDFNFFRFNPTNPNERFTPYLTFGAGVFGFNPYAYLGDTKYFLQPLGTEGQGSAVYPDRTPYSTTAIAFPVGLGVKYAFNDRWNLNIEVAHRFTTTDYLDDVSSTYAGIGAFKAGSPASFLQDRSYETGAIIGAQGNQRGFGKQKDQYVMATVGITFSFSSYRCPTSR